MKRITIPEIAKELGVSIGTVDRAIHNRPGINEETKQKVLDLVQKYNYKTDRVARAMSRKNKGKKIGVIIKKTPEFYWSRVKNGIMTMESELNGFGIEVVYKEPRKEKITEDIAQYIKYFINEGFDAIILVPVNNPKIKSLISEACENNITVVTLNDDIEDSKRLFYVGPQIKQSGRLAAELMGLMLSSKGNVITVNNNNVSWEYQQRLEGFRELLHERYKGIKIIAEYTYNYEESINNSKVILKSILENTDNVNGIYDVSGASLHTVGEIIKESEKLRNVILIGHETWVNVRELIKEGIIKACISQDPYSQGYYSLRYLYSYLEDGVKPQYERLYTRLDIVTRENLDIVDNIVNS